MPGVVVGVGSEIPERSNAARFRQKFNIRDRFAIYVGRIDENKGCAELFDFFQRYSASLVEGMHLVLIGTPHHPDSRSIRASITSASSTIRTSSTRMAAAEAADHAVVSREPVDGGARSLGDGQAGARQRECDVLKGQCIRSNGGLYYDNFPEFAETLRAIDFTPSLRRRSVATAARSSSAITRGR